MTNHLPLPTLLLGCLGAGLLAGTSGAQDLLLDINLEGPGNPSSSIRELTSTGTHALFSATNSSTGAELWTSDGTAAGTLQLADLQQGINGSNPSDLVTLPNGLTVFAATGEFGRELHVTDGTTSFTKQLFDLYPGAASGFVKGSVLFGGKAYFFANSPGAGIELWSTDGTEAGTALAHEFTPGAAGSMTTFFPGWLTTSDSQLFAFAKSPNGPGWALYAGDPSTTGMSFVADITGSGLDQIRGFASVGNKIVFGAPSTTLGDEVWISDGTASGTFMVDLDSASESMPDDFVAMGGHVYFAATHSQIGRELVRTDGTAAGTELVRDIEPSQFPFFASSSPDLLGVAGGRLILDATTVSGGRQLWSSDGTAIGTFPISEAIGFEFGNAQGVQFGNELVFTVAIGVDDLWITDGTANGTRQATNITPNSINPIIGLPVVAGGQLLFSANDGVHGSELWVSDATPAGTSMVLDIALSTSNFGSNAHGFTKVGDDAFFVAERTGEPEQIWKTDGTTAGTVQVSDFPLLNVTGITLGTEFNGLLFFLGNDPVHGGEPWISDGTTAGTHILADIFAGVGASNWGMPDHAVVGDKLFFTGLEQSNGFEVFVTDGTTQGTMRAPNLDLPTNFGFMGDLHSAGDALYFSALDSNFGVTMHRYDTLTETLTSLGDFNPNGDDTSLNGGAISTPAGVLFAGDDGVNGIELWIDDNGRTGPRMLVDLDPGATGSQPHSFANLGDLALFTTGTQFGNSGLWSSDGTVLGTTQLASNEGIVRSAWTVCRDVAFIWAVDVMGQDTLFVTDGTVSGTRTLLSTTFQSSFSTITTQIGSGNLVAFQNHDAVFGNETWISDATVAGTHMVADSIPGNHGSYPSGFTRVGDSVVFSGRLEGVGTELLRFDLFGLGGYVAETYGEGCNGSNGQAPSISVTIEPSVFTPFGVNINDAAPRATGFAYHSASKANVLVAGGCMINVELGIQPIVFTTDNGGDAQIPVVLDASFAGRQIFVQAFVLDAGGDLFGLASATTGLELVVGP